MCALQRRASFRSRVLPVLPRVCTFGGAKDALSRVSVRRSGTVLLRVGLLEAATSRDFRWRLWDRFAGHASNSSFGGVSDGQCFRKSKGGIASVLGERARWRSCFKKSTFPLRVLRTPWKRTADLRQCRKFFNVRGSEGAEEVESRYCYFLLDAFQRGLHAGRALQRLSVLSATTPQRQSISAMRQRRFGVHPYRSGREGPCRKTVRKNSSPNPTTQEAVVVCKQRE